MSTITHRTKLPKAFKAKWVKALRSGKYKQGTGALLRINEDFNTGIQTREYCCLGVACAVGGNDSDQLAGRYYPNDVKGAKVPDILLNDHGLQGKLASMNDDSKRSFKQIAAYIDRYL